LAYSVVELVLSQTVLDERGLEHGDHVLAIGMGCPQVATASRGQIWRGRIVWAPDQPRRR
jgi:hypothetical protein